MPQTLPTSAANNDSNVKPACCCRRALHWRKTDLGLSLFGVVGWLLLPKCPVCLAAWVAMLSGLSLSFDASNFVLILLTILAASCILVGMIRIGITSRNNLKRCEN